MSDQTPPPASEPAPGPVKAASLGPEAVKPRKPLFGRDTKAGRALRAVIRTIAFIVGFYALGFFTAYLLLYRPLQVQQRANLVELEQLRKDVADKQAELDKAGLSMAGVQQQNTGLAAEAEKRGAQVTVLQALNQVMEARLKLAAKDTSAARLALEQAEKTLTPALPQLEKLGGASAATFTQLFDLARTDLGRNATLADQDLERLSSELQLISATLSK